MEEKKMYKVTNKVNDVRRFRDRFLGKDILVEPKKFIFTNKPPEESDIWKVEIVEKQRTIEKLEEKKQINKRRLIKNDSSSNR